MTIAEALAMIEYLDRRIEELGSAYSAIMQGDGRIYHRVEFGGARLVGFEIGVDHVTDVLAGERAIAKAKVGQLRVKLAKAQVAFEEPAKDGPTKPEWFDVDVPDEPTP